MRPPPAIFVLLVAAGCAALVVLQLIGLAIPAAIAKLVASCSFIGVALASGATRSLYGRAILAGLAFSWFGDMFLVGQSQVFFYAGLVAFLLGHIAYIAAFAAHGVDGRWLFAAALPVAVAATLVTIWLTPHTAPQLLVPVRTYTVVISVMVVMSFGARGAGGPWIMVAGAVLFYLSDLSVAALRLVETAWPTYALGLPFYYGGQVLLALSTRSQSESQLGSPEK
ncbi:MAG: lysoplasmalogenase family protein [Woeseiaceae bacterium]|nr:lysoplasmalogenase family protein [Woeseiaceae bacterium]